MTLHLGILLALLCAFATNLAFFYKHRGACAVPPVSIAHPLHSAAGAVALEVVRDRHARRRSAPGCCTSPRSALAPMSVVQAVLAGGVVLIAVMAERMFGFRVGRRQWWGLGLTPPASSCSAITMPRTGGTHDSLLGRRDDLLRGRPARRRRPADHRPARRAPRSAPRRDARRRRGRPLRRLRRRHQGAHRHGRRRRRPGAREPVDARRARRLGRRLLRLGARPAGRRGRPGHRDHRHRRQRLRHRRRDHRLRRPAARRRARHRRPGDRLRAGDRRLRADARPRAATGAPPPRCACAAA